MGESPSDSGFWLAMERADGRAKMIDTRERETRFQRNALDAGQEDKSAMSPPELWVI